ncbi:MAG: GGDEF domain-containing protein [Deltaproteobacteria bacterium]|nr:GGDEF domain-containing protein [Deltaproteobacteria bacterium]
MAIRPRTRSSFDRPRKGSRPPRSLLSNGQETADSLPSFTPPPDEFTSGKTTNVARPPASASDHKPCLTVISGRLEGQLFPMDTPDVVTIGRAADSDLRLDDDGVSRKHAQIIVTAESVILEDLGSRNGTFVGEQPVKRTPLNANDLIRVGSTTIIKFSWMNETEHSHHERLREAALLDPLTGIYNRRHFDESLGSERAAAQRHRKPLSLIIADLDNFKRVNDEHGHPVGDAVLSAMGEAILRCARREDLAFRFGGEEFAVLARDTDLDGAVRFAERLRVEIENVTVDGKDRRPLKFTASVGVAQLAAKETEKDLLERADSAMYNAKRGGKNRVMVSERKLTPID